MASIRGEHGTHRDHFNAVKIFCSHVTEIFLQPPSPATGPDSAGEQVCLLAGISSANGGTSVMLV